MNMKTKLLGLLSIVFMVYGYGSGSHAHAACRESVDANARLNEVEVRAVVGMWLANDRKLRSVVYEGETRIVQEGGPDLIPHRVGRFGESICGDWFVDVSKNAYEPQTRGGEGAEETVTERISVESGEMRWWNAEDRYGYIEPETDYRSGTVTPFILIGRVLTVGSDVPTGDLLPAMLLEDDGLCGEWVELNGNDLYKVEGRAVTNRKVTYRVVAYLDPAVGFMPVRISTHLPGFRSESMRLEVEQYHTTSDRVHVPVKGMRSIFVRAELSDLDSKKLQSAIADSNLDLSAIDYSDRLEVERLEQIVTSIFGSDGVPVERIMGGGYALKVTRIISVNSGIDANDLMKTFPDDSIVASRYSGRNAFYVVKHGQLVPASEDLVDRHFERVARESE